MASKLPHQFQLERLRDLLQRFRVENHLVDVSAGQRHDLEASLVHRQQAVELERRLRGIHIADLASLMESMPTEDRALVWAYLPDGRRGEALLEVSDAVRDSLVGATPPADLLRALAGLDADDLAYLGDALPPEVLQSALDARASDEQRWVQASLSYPEDRVGHWMTSDMVVVRQHELLGNVQQYLQELAELPAHSDKLLVTDQRGTLAGVLFLKDILINPPDRRASDVMRTAVVSFKPDDAVDEAARAFERYDLVSAPVLNPRGKLVGRLTVDTVMDYVRENAEMDTLNIAGVVESEDLFAGVLASAKNRWLWLSINLVSAFIVSRIVGAFEGTIAKMVALASLMPIVASVSGNTGNQTTALVIRSLATNQIHPGNISHVFRKELSISALNGAVWGSVVGLFAFVFYRSPDLSAVLMLAMVLTFLAAAAFGVGAPLLLYKLGRDPAMGSSVMLTAVTDALSFLIFLALASVLLV